MRESETRLAYYRQHAAEMRLLANRAGMAEFRPAYLMLEANWPKLAEQGAEPRLVPAPRLCLSATSSGNSGAARDADRNIGSARPLSVSMSNGF